MSAPRLRAALVLVLAWTPALAQAPNRLWIGRVELVGPLERVELDCGPDGVTHVRGPLVAGERRELAVPLPWAPPLGLEGLARQAAPEVRVEPAGAGGSARWLGVAADQPEARWSRLPVGLRARPRPPAGRAQPAAPVAALLAALAAQAVALGAVRRGRRAGTHAWAHRAAAAAILVGGALAAGGLAARGLRAVDGATTVLLEVDRPAAGPTGTAAAFAVRATTAVAALDLDPERPGLRLEAVPADARVRWEVDLGAGTWSARTDGVLVGFASALPPEPGSLALAPAWWRDAAGAWSRYAAVAGGAGTPAPGADPPGWLRAGLPPGRPALLGRAAPAPGHPPDAGWVRDVGAGRPEAAAGGAPGGERD